MPLTQEHEPGDDAADGTQGEGAAAPVGIEGDVDFSTAQSERQARRRPVRRTRDLTKGSVPRNLWFLAWPQMVEGVFNSLDRRALDTFGTVRSTGR